jgi:hypothetical protein
VSSKAQASGCEGDDSHYCGATYDDSAWSAQKGIGTTHPICRYRRTALPYWSVPRPGSTFWRFRPEPLPVSVHAMSRSRHRAWRSDFARLNTARRLTINMLAWLGTVLWLLVAFWADGSNLAFLLITLASLAIIASFVVFRSSARRWRDER